MQFDLLIAGGGMVGASLALALDHYGQGQLRVAVVEGAPLPESSAEQGPIPYSTSFDARSSALTFGCRKIFEELGLWQDLVRHLTPIERIHVSDRGRLGSVEMDCAEAGWEALGYVTENVWLGRVLLAKLQDCSGVTLISPETVTELEPNDSGVFATLAGGESIQADLAVIADGAQSSLREQLGIAVEVADYRQSALIANVCFTKPHRNVAFERFTERGPVALLPLADSDRGEPRSALVWTTPEAEVAEMLDCSDQNFLEALQQWFGNRVGQFTRVGERFAYPLRLVQAKEQVRSSVVVVGNAAHAMHPVAGQGFNLALRDVVSLAKNVAESRQCGERIGDLAQLQRYLQRQQLDQDLTISFSDGVTRLFSNRLPVLSTLRSLGLLGMSVVPPIKRDFIQRASGMNSGVAQG